MNHPVAVITGAGKGIGRATAIELARRGYALALAARTDSDLLQTLSAAEATDRGIAVPTDVSKYAEIDRLIDVTLDRFDRIDAIVHCAGIAPVRSLAAMTPAEWQETIDTNLSAAFHLIRAAWPAFERQRGGAIVNVSSLATRDPFPGFGAYGAAKAGMNLLGLMAAREGEPIGVRAYTVAPGAVETGMFRKIMTPEQFPKEKTLDPADVARVIAGCIQGDLRYASGEVIYLHRTAT
ncbi:SDR family NAD(P)-dependent oxidoreductase [Humisphaera borealis]|uniref:SDR family oxidoreductase n=1 Tax=Humisphaera borealis TaxID=2807512 RepID=A0A7M2WPM7_9BACT|nr:SDR family oxidoreductase [Humisphaera borealis]QOV87475.1 SDR family oxidoreductase [Humisphaera borealis]